jgi:hypothetical protein
MGMKRLRVRGLKKVSLKVYLKTLALNCHRVWKHMLQKLDFDRLQLNVLGQ